MIQPADSARILASQVERIAIMSSRVVIPAAASSSPLILFAAEKASLSDVPVKVERISVAQVICFALPFMVLALVFGGELLAVHEY